MNELLYSGLEKLGLGDDEKLGKLETFLSELMLFNPSYRLVSQTDEREIVVRHILDSAAAVPYLSSLNPDSVIDLGSGGGFPGIVLATLMDDVSFTFSERMARRVSFLKNEVLLLSLKNVRVISDDSFNISEKFPVATARGFHPVYDIYPEVAKLLAPGGRMVLYKGPGKNVEKEMAETEKRFGRIGYSIIDISVPFLDEERTLLVIEV